MLLGYWGDDLTTNTCYFAQEVDNLRYKNNSIYEDVMYLKDDIAPYYGEALDLPEEKVANMTFNDAYLYADAIFSQMFEGIPQKVDWTKQ